MSRMPAFPATSASSMVELEWRIVSCAGRRNPDVSCGFMRNPPLCGTVRRSVAVALMTEGGAGLASRHIRATPRRRAGRRVGGGAQRTPGWEHPGQRLLLLGEIGVAGRPRWFASTPGPSRSAINAVLAPASRSCVLALWQNTWGRHELRRQRGARRSGGSDMPPDHPANCVPAQRATARSGAGHLGRRRLLEPTAEDGSGAGVSGVQRCLLPLPVHETLAPTTEGDVATQVPQSSETRRRVWMASTSREWSRRPRRVPRWGAGDERVDPAE